jgi:2-dehydro-3-deoxyglucarate aldolase
VDSFVGAEDDEILVGTMIENERAVENIEEILAVPHLGFAFVGPADLAMSMSDGDPLEKSSQAVDTAIDRTLDACLTAGVPVGRIRNDVEQARAAAEAGYQILRVGGDVSAMRSTLGGRLDGLTDG